jgi:hypothetical protein
MMPGGARHFSLWCMLAAPLIAGSDALIESLQSAQTLSNARDRLVRYKPAPAHVLLCVF